MSQTLKFFCLDFCLNFFLKSLFLRKFLEIIFYAYIIKMGGGLMQLVAYGAQDVYLTGNPQITFFKVVYRRHTNFSMECILQTMNGSVSGGGRSTVTIARNGDLVYKMHVKATRAGGTAIVNEGAGQFSSVELEIGGQQIDKHSGQYIETYAELHHNKTGRAFGSNYQITTGTCEGAGMQNNVTATDDATAPIPFASVDTQAHKIYTPLNFWFNTNAGLALPLIALQYHEVKVIFNWASTVSTGSQELWCDYIYLDTDERRRFAQVSHEYLIEQVQEVSGQASLSQELTFNHPVKEIIITGAATTSGGSMTFAALADTTWKLVLNGHDRMAEQNTSYYTRKVPNDCHSGSAIIIDSIGVYSFALRPEEHQPSGTCNFSRIDNSRLVAGATGVPAAGRIFAVNYNVLRIMSGMGGLAYSN